MESRKPNVLLIHADQHRFDCLGCYGNFDVKTPALDGLARDGVRYTNCFTTCPVCTPARYSLLTGLYVHQHLGWTNRSTLPFGLSTFPRVLKQAGYSTCCVGKMHFTPTYAELGFERMLLAEQDGPGRWDDDYHRYLMSLGLVDYIDMRDQIFEFRKKAPKEYFEDFGIEPSNLDEQYYSTTWIGNNALDILNQWDDNTPNLLFIGFIKPHHPHDAPPPWCEMYNYSDLSLLPGWTDECLESDLRKYRGYFDNTRLNETKMKRILSQYYAAITHIDHHIGLLLNVLKERGLYDDTLIIYMSDHGDYMGYHHLVLKGNYMYDPLVRVPLIIKYPRSIEAPENKVNPGLVSTVDITATILDVTGCQIPKTLWSIAEPLQESEGKPAVFSENNRGEYMIRTHSRKLLLCESSPSKLLDLENDPFELENVIEDSRYRDDLAQLKQSLFKWLAFYSRTPTHINNHAPIIKTANARKSHDARRESIKAWFREKYEALNSKSRE
ncbi:MAG: sulfatase-like hydrolase/transferase [Promethearchaeota archaeon]